MEILATRSKDRLYHTLSLVHITPVLRKMLSECSILFILRTPSASVPIKHYLLVTQADVWFFYEKELSIILEDHPNHYWLGTSITSLLEACTHDTQKAKISLTSLPTKKNFSAPLITFCYAETLTGKDLKLLQTADTKWRLELKAIHSGDEPLPKQVFPQSALKARHASEVYALCEMTAIYMYRFLKKDTFLVELENEGREYLMAKTHGEGLYEVSVQAVRLTHLETESKNKILHQIQDPSVLLLRIQLSWKGVSACFTKTVTYATAPLAQPFVERYEYFQKILATFLATVEHGGTIAPAHQHCTTLALTVIKQHNGFIPLTVEGFKDFCSAAEEDTINLLIHEKNKDQKIESIQPSPLRIIESLFIRKQLAAPRANRLIFTQNPPYHKGILCFF